MGLTVENFLSAASGMAVLVAVIRGFVRHNADTLGNFWVDSTRTILCILLPLSVLIAVLLAGQGVVQTLGPYQTISLLEETRYERPYRNETGESIQDFQDNPVIRPILVREQILALGPVASQVAIKQLGTNGGGFFSVNSAHPFENPTPFSNFIEMLAILLIPAALCHTFGAMVKDSRQGWAILYAFSSAGNNNGSAFAGLSANNPFYNLLLGVVMWFARYWVAVPTLAIAGALAAKKIVPPGAGTLATHTPMFVGLLIGVVVVGALTFIPALALGPVVEQLMMVGVK